MFFCSNVTILSLTSDLSIAHAPVKSIEGKSKTITVNDNNLFICSFIKS